MLKDWAMDNHIKTDPNTVNASLRIQKVRTAPNGVSWKRGKFKDKPWRDVTWRLCRAHNFESITDLSTNCKNVAYDRVPLVPYYQNQKDMSTESWWGYKTKRNVLKIKKFRVEVNKDLNRNIRACFQHAARTMKIKGMTAALIKRISLYTVEHMS